MKLKVKEKIENILKANSRAFIIDLVESLVIFGYELGASDIHINPGEDSLRARFRVDGSLKDYFILPKNIHSEVITRIKILSNLRTDEHQAPQDGRFRLIFYEKKFLDIRVSIVRTYYGENVVMRLLTDFLSVSALENLDLNKSNLNKILRAVKKPYGMILTTGSTGSGKTTTLYALIKILNQPELSIVTVEDPVEYSIAGVQQIQVNLRANLNFAQGLRAVLRQDPNIIMVGEIRDLETAKVAISAALTGHLLLSSLHTISPAATLPRLLDMGIENYLVATTVNLIIGQKLFKRICGYCRAEKKLSEFELINLESLNLKTHKNFFYGKGCDACEMTGYKGRVAVHEVLEIDNKISEAILHKASASEIHKIAILNGMQTFKEDALEKAEQGLVSLEEILANMANS